MRDAFFVYTRIRTLNFLLSGGKQPIGRMLLLTRLQMLYRMTRQKDAKDEP
jgi:hypothetical protein